MAQSKAFVDASHSLNELSHALALLESENSSLRGAVDGFTSENAKLRKLTSRVWKLFLKHGAVHPCDLLDVDAVRDEMRELGMEVDE